MESDYEPPWLAELFHSFPHLDLTFEFVNSTFSPQDNRYRESLVFWAAIPVLWLLVTLLIFLLYFCYRCCQRDLEKKQRVPCLRWSMAILALLTCGVVGVGFYGNEEAHKGIKEFQTAAENANTVVSDMKNEVANLQMHIDETAARGIRGLESVFKNHPDLKSQVQRNLTNMTATANDLSEKIMKSATRISKRTRNVDMSPMTDYIKEYRFYVWLGTLIFLAWMVVLCLLLLLGIGLSSKCTLLLFCALGIFTLVMCWIVAGIYLGTSVGVSDFCVAPEEYIESMRTDPKEKEILDYYLKCTEPHSSPFRGAIKRAQDSIHQANQTIKQAVQLAIKDIPYNELPQMEIEVKRHEATVADGLNETYDSITRLITLTSCDKLNSEFSSGIEGMCYTALPGLVFILLSAVVAGLLFTILILLASRAWRHFSKTKGYLEVEEDDPFLPRPDSTSPSYYSFTRGHRGAASAPPRETMSMNRRSTPPPAYNSYDYRGNQNNMEMPPHGGPDDYNDYNVRETNA